jgi:hypothetical protein
MPPYGRDYPTFRDIGQNARQQNRAVPISLAQRGDFGELAAECGHGAVLDEGGAAEIHAQQEIEEMVGKLRRSDDPAEAEASHRMRFRKAGDDDRALRHVRQRPRADMRPSKGEVLINLVGDGQRSCSRHSSAMPAISSAVNTAPVGLCGLLIQITRVRGVNARAKLSTSG